MTSTPTTTPLDDFSAAMEAHGHSREAIVAAALLGTGAEEAGLAPYSRLPRPTLAFRWPLSERKVGAIFSMWPCEGELVFELRWLLSEPAFHGKAAGDELVERLARLPVDWRRAPQERGFPNMSLAPLENPGRLEAVRDVVVWIVERLDAFGSDAIEPPFPSQLTLTDVPTTDVESPYEQVRTQIDAILDRFVKRYELPHTRGTGGSLEVPRTYEPVLGRGLMVNLSRRGLDGTILQVIVTPDRLTPGERWADMLAACNEWNANERWPKMYLRDDAPESGISEAGMVIAEASIDLKCGVNEAFLADWVNDMIGTSFDFWRWITTVKGL